MHKWQFYTSQNLKPQGWLRRQLELQAAGLAGNLDRIWRDVRDSAWIGGDAEGWERVPYWLDGFIPLAYLLEDEGMIARARRYVDAILSFQRPSGWICPCRDEDIPTYDTWAVQLISKVLVVYYECSSDERIPGALYRCFKNYYDLLSSGTIKLFKWGRFRWFEAFVALDFLVRRYDEAWIYELAQLLRAQGANYRDFEERWKHPKNMWAFETHIVNLAMMLKQEAISADILHEKYTDLAERFVTLLEQYNGTPVGLFTGDECLSGLSPIQGTELCAVAEQMYSYEWLYAYTGDSRWAERLELLAFNALPATISDDMWTHQYVQQSNQIACQRFPTRPIFRTNGKEANLFGLEPNFGCCTANFGQAWPKLALSTFMHSGDTVVSVVPLPSRLTTADFTITLETDYPFKNRLQYTVETRKALTLKVRIPSFAKRVTVNGKRVDVSGELSVDVGMSGACILVEFETEPIIVERPHSLKTVRCGSLVFSLPISNEKKMYEYEKNGVERKYPYCDYEYLPTSEWSYAYSSPFFRTEARDVPDVPFDSVRPPMVVRAEVRRIAWGLEDGFDSVCAKTPGSLLPLSEPQEVELYPYGCAKLRMTELPLI